MLACLATLAVTYTQNNPMSFGFFDESVKEHRTQKQSLSFVGDVLLARNVEYIQNVHGADYVFQQMPTISSTTYLIGNFEAAVPKVHKKTPDMTMSFSVPTTSLPSLRDAGFSYMGLANNHSYDKGIENFFHTREQLQDVGLQVFGDQQLSSTTVTHIALQDKTVSLLGLYAVHTAPDKQKLYELVQKEMLKHDIVIAYIHWGEEYQTHHSPFQEDLAHALIDYGVDVIVGHHPHVVQDIEQYKGATIFYSLGNFVFDQYFSKEVQEGLWVTLQPQEDGIYFQLHPVTSLGSLSQPRLMSNHDAELFLEALDARSSLHEKKSLSNGFFTQ